MTFELEFDKNTNKGVTTTRFGFRISAIIFY